MRSTPGPRCSSSMKSDTYPSRRQQACSSKSSARDTKNDTPLDDEAQETALCFNEHSRRRTTVSERRAPSIRGGGHASRASGDARSQPRRHQGRGSQPNSAHAEFGCSRKTVPITRSTLQSIRASAHNWLLILDAAANSGCRDPKGLKEYDSRHLH